MDAQQISNHTKEWNIYSHIFRRWVSVCAMHVYVCVCVKRKSAQRGLFSQHFMFTFVERYNNIKNKRKLNK